MTAAHRCSANVTRAQDVRSSGNDCLSRRSNRLHPSTSKDPGGIEAVDPGNRNINRLHARLHDRRFEKAFAPLCSTLGLSAEVVTKIGATVFYLVVRRWVIESTSFLFVNNLLLHIYTGSFAPASAGFK